MDNSNFRTVSDMTTLRNLEKLNPPADEIVYVEECEQLYICKNGTYEPYAPAVSDESGLNMSIYDLNKAVIAQLPTLNDDALHECMVEINEWRCDTNNQYYMLYGREISYFTLAHVSDGQNTFSLGDVVLECLNSIGEIKSIDKVPDGNAFEIWVHYAAEDLMTCLYLFPYDSGVVEIGA